MAPRNACARPAAVLLAAFAVLACQPKRGTGPVADGTHARGAGTGSHATAGDRPQEARLPEGGKTGGDPDTQRGTDGAAPRVQPIDADPQRVLGAHADSLAARLGTPSQRRREAAARVWQYRLEACVLDIVLYPEDGTPVVAHVEARDRQGAPMPTDQCLRRLLKQRASAQDDGTPQ